MSYAVTDNGCANALKQRFSQKVCDTLQIHWNLGLETLDNQIWFFDMNSPVFSALHSLNLETSTETGL